MSRSNAGMNAIYNGGLSGSTSMHGLGRHRGMHGRGFFDFIKKANNFVKDNQLISKGLALGEQLGLNDKLRESGIGNALLKGAEFASTKGYGRRRRRVRRRMGGSGSKRAIRGHRGGRKRRVGRPRVRR